MHLSPFAGAHRARLEGSAVARAIRFARRTVCLTSREYQSGRRPAIEPVDVHRRPKNSTKAIHEMFPELHSGKGQIWLKKSLEADVLLALQFWPALKAIEFGPPVLDWEYEHIRLKSAFLMAWRFCDGRRVLVDVISRDVIRRHRLMSFVPALRRAARSAGYDDFHLISESVLPNAIMLENAALVHASARDPKTLNDALIKVIQREGPLTIGDLRARFADTPCPFRAIMTAFAGGDVMPLRIDLPFDDKTVVALKDDTKLKIRRCALHRRPFVGPHARSRTSRCEISRFLGLPQEKRRIAAWRWSHVDFAQRAFQRFQGRKGFERRPEKGYARLARFAAIWVKRRDVRRRLKRAGFDGFASPSGSTLRNWCLQARTPEALSPESLVPKSSGTCRLDPSVAQAIDEQVENFWLTKERPTPSALHAKVRSALAAQGVWASATMPARTTIQRRIDMKLPCATIVDRREGTRALEEKYSPVLKAREVGIPLQEVQIDHARLDFMALTDEAGSADMPPASRAFRPYLTVAIDRATGMIFGFHIGKGAPSTDSILACLSSGILKKNIQALGAANPWPVEGIPQSILVDNGADFASDRLAEACAALHIRLRFAPAYSPRTKGIVEGFIKNVQHRFAVRPGRTFHNALAKGFNQPAHDARETLNDVREAFTRWVVDDYHIQPRSHHHQGLSPLQAWQMLQPQWQVRPYNDRDVLSLISSRVFRLGVDRQGIRLAPLSLRYNSEELAHRLRTWAKADRGAVQQRLDANDISFIHVFDPKSNEWFRVSCVTPRVKQGLTLEEWEAALIASPKVRNPISTNASGEPASSMVTGSARSCAAVRKKRKTLTQRTSKPVGVSPVLKNALCEDDLAALYLGK